MNKNIKLIFNYLLGPLLFIILSWSLYRQIIHQPDLPERWNEVKHSWQSAKFWFVFFLMFVNWGIEAKKWQLLLMPLEQFSLLKSFKSVLAGCSITMLTPNRIGEYGGRIMNVKETNRLKAISLTVLGSMSQLLITILMGTTGLIVFKYFLHTGNLITGVLPWLLNDLLLCLSLCITVILALLYFRVDFLINVISKIKFLKSLVKYISITSVFSGKQLLRILFLSFLRYMVFILQYVLLLQVMKVDITFETSFLLLTLFYLVMAVVPTIGFTELPVRATASVALFKIFSPNILGIQAAAFGIWIINLVIPAVIGSILILGIKIMDER